MWTILARAAASLTSLCVSWASNPFAGRARQAQNHASCRSVGGRVIARHVVVAVLALSAFGCGGGGSGAGAPGPAPAATSYVVRVQVTGLHSSERLELTLNGGSPIAFTGAGSATFPTSLVSGRSFDVAIRSRPRTAACSSTNASGTVAGADASVTFVCVDAPIDLRQVADVNTTSRNHGSKPFGFIGFGSRIAFAVFLKEFPGLINEGTTRLYLSDGSPGPAMPVTDTSMQTVAPVAELGGKLLFIRQSQTPIIGGYQSGPRELWASDGNIGNNRQIAASGPNGLTFAHFGDRIIYGAGAPGAAELWRTDGTAPGSTRVALPAGISVAFPAVYRVGQTAVFVASDGSTARLWQTDGTANGTRPISSASLSVWEVLGVAADRLYFMAAQGSGFDTALWSTNGAVGAETLVANFVPADDDRIRCFAAVGSGYYLAAPDVPGREAVWVSNGASAPTRVMGNLTEPCGFRSFNGRVYFSVAGNGSSTLWRTAGTSASTEQVATGAVTLRSFAVYFGFELNGRLILPGRTAATGLEYWATADGSTFELLDDIAPGPDSGLIDSAPFVDVIGGRAYFRASDGVTGEEPWTTDGTTAGTYLLDNVRPETETLDGVRKILGYTSQGIFFQGCTTANGCELWISNGTPAGTREVVNLNGSASSTPNRAGVAGDTFVFTNALGGVWSSDGTAPGTQQVAAPDIWRSYSRADELLFVDNEFPRRLWRTDGTSAGTIRLGTDFSEAGGFVDFKGFTYFAAQDDNGEPGLYRTDGTITGTERVVQAPVFVAAPQLVAISGYLLFNSSDSQYGNELWRSDGTPAGTALVQDMYPGPESGYAAALTVFGNEVIFRGRTGENEWGIYRTDGTTVTRLRALTLDNLAQFLAMPDGLYFIADYAVWKFDGNSVRQIATRPGVQADNPYAIARALDGVVVNAFEGTKGQTYLIVDDVLMRASPQVAASYEQSLFVPQGTLQGTYFIGDDSRTGEELWVLRRGP